MTGPGMTRRLIVVAGMHRSGTSLIAQILHALGAYLGEYVEREPVPSNQSGHWEHAAAWRIQEGLLAALGQGWNDVAGPMPPRWTEWPEARAARRDLTALAAQHLARGGHWVVKDPRSSRLLPLWADIAEALEADLRVVAGRRAPGSVVRSLVARDGMTEAQAWRLWQHYDAALTSFALLAPVHVVDYDRLLAQGRATIEQLAQFCGIPVTADRLRGSEMLILRPLRHHLVTVDGGQGSETMQRPPSVSPEPITALAALPGRIRIYLRTAWNEAALLRALKGILAQDHADWDLCLVAEAPLHPLIRTTLAPYDHLLAGRAVLRTIAESDADLPRPVAALAMTEFGHWPPDALRGALAAWRGEGTGSASPGLVGWDLAFAPSAPDAASIGDRLAVIEAAAQTRRKADPVQDDAPGATPDAAAIEILEASPLRLDWPPLGQAGAMPLQLLPGTDMREADGLWVSAGVDPQIHFVMAGRGAHLAQTAGLYLLQFRCEVVSNQPAPRLYARPAQDFSERQSIGLTPAAGGRYAVLVNAQAGLNGLRLDPSEGVPSAARIESPTLLRLSDALSALAAPRRQARFPDVLCIGAQRSATTWLHHHLMRLPEIWKAPVKEFHHFDSLGSLDEFERQKQRMAFELLAAAGDDASRRFALRLGFPAAHGWGSYLDLFADAPPAQRALDFTPAYATLAEERVREIARVMPTTRILFILRDPVERSLSGAFHEARLRGLAPTPETLAALTREAANHARSDYLTTMDRWCRHVPADRIRILFYDDLLRDPAAFFAAACGFIGVDPKGHDLIALQSPINQGTRPAEQQALAPLRAALSLQWLPQLRALAARYPDPCRSWEVAAATRIEAALQAPDITPQSR